MLSLVVRHYRRRAFRRWRRAVLHGAPVRPTRKYRVSRR